jgi:GntR family transcriptional regulator
MREDMTSSDNRSVEEPIVGRSLYEQVAAGLRARIQSGQLASGQRLGAEQELAAEFSVSRPTIRSALAKLQDEGLVLKRQGLGSFVRPQRVHQTLGRLETLGESIAEQGGACRIRILSRVFGPPSEEVRSALALPTGAETLLFRRLHVVNEEPIALVLLSVAEALGSQLTRRDIETQTLYELLPSRLGIDIGRAVQSMRAEPADEPTAQALKIAVGSCLLVCERVTFSKDDQPVIHALFKYRADRFEFRIALAPHVRKVDWLPPGLMPLSGAIT